MGIKNLIKETWTDLYNFIEEFVIIMTTISGMILIISPALLVIYLSLKSLWFLLLFPIALFLSFIIKNLIDKYIK